MVEWAGAPRQERRPGRHAVGALADDAYAVIADVQGGCILVLVEHQGRKSKAVQCLFLSLLLCLEQAEDPRYPYVRILPDDVFRSKESLLFQYLFSKPYHFPFLFAFGILKNTFFSFKYFCIYIYKNLHTILFSLKL